MQREEGVSRQVIVVGGGSGGGGSGGSLRKRATVEDKIGVINLPTRGSDRCGRQKDAYSSTRS
jgi:hypothetical protein